MRMHAHNALVLNIALLMMLMSSDLSSADTKDLKVTGHLGRMAGVQPRSAIRDFVVAHDGSFLLAYTDEKTVRTVSAENKLMREQVLDYEPHYISTAVDGGFYAAGSCVDPDVNVVHYDSDGKEVARLDPELIPWPAGITVHQRLGTSQIKRFTDKVYVGFNYGGMHTHSKEMLVRFDLSLTNPKVIVSDCRGCCGHIPMTFDSAGNIYISDSSVYQVRKFNDEGEQLAGWKRKYNRNYDPRGLCPDGKGGVYVVTGNGMLEHQDGQGKLLAQVRLNCDFNQLRPVVRTERELRFVRETGNRWWSTRKVTSQAWCLPCYIPVHINHESGQLYLLDSGQRVVRVFEWGNS